MQTLLARLACCSCLLLVGLNACSASTDANAPGIGKKQLGQEESLRIRRFLHPMPQELRMAPAAYQVPANECGLEINPDAASVEKQMIADFKGRWRTKHGTDLKENDARLTVIAGVLKNSPVLQKSAENGVFDAKYLAERPNAEQAYSIATVAEDGKIKVYIAANDNPGLYYGLLTFEQLFEGLSKDAQLVFPHCSIVDWPDIRGRGSWVALGGVYDKNFEAFVRACEKRIKMFAELKFNMIEAERLSPDKLDENGCLVVRWTFPKEIIKLGERYAVDILPTTSHITAHVLRQPLLQKKFPGAQGQNAAGERGGMCLCHSHPDTKKFLTEYLVTIAGQYDVATVWMTEVEGPKGGCHCKDCKGDLRKAFITETKTIMAAYAEAQRANPRFKIVLGLTQGTYPHHFEMLKYIPRDVRLTFYSGIMTYRAEFQKYNLPPSVQEIKRQGYTLGSMPSPVPWATTLFGPFQTPQYVRFLCGEAEDLNLDFVDAFLWPDPFFFALNSEALAEFLWNSKGRTAKEFTIAWATRKGLPQPEETAAIIEMLEYPERGFYNCHFRMFIAEVANFVAGVDRPSRMALHGYEFSTHAEMARSLGICEEAAGRAAKLNNPELRAGCELMRCAAIILERYAYCLDNPADKAGKEQAIASIRQQLGLYPELFNKWFDTKNPTEYTRRSMALENKKWTQILEQIRKSDVSPATKILLGAYKQGGLTVMKLDPAWKFKCAENDEGLTQKWFAAEFDDRSWSGIKAGEYWDKQGYEGYIGRAWYRQKLALPDKMKNRKHLYLVFEGVDEDAEVFINGEKIFTHSHETVGGNPGSTWDKPFSFDIKSVLKPGAANTLAVRVYNRGGAGGIYKNVYLVGADQPAATDGLLAVTMQFENDSFDDLL